MSNDGQSLFFSSDRPGGQGTSDLYVATRASATDPWGPVVNLGGAINSPDYEQYPFLSPNGSDLLFVRAQQDYNDASRDIYQSHLLSFDAKPLAGNGGTYSEPFDDSLSADASQSGASLPSGWTFTANDIVFNNATTQSFPVRATSTRPYAGVYNAGADGSADRTLVTDVTANEQGELDFRTLVTDSDLQALRLGFDIEAWQLRSELGANLGEAAFGVVLEADSGSGFQQVADLGEFSTGKTLVRPATGTQVDGNDPAYRDSFDSQSVDLDVPAGATLRIRWKSTESSKNVVFGLDNVSLRFAAPGDADIDGLFNSQDLVNVFQVGEYEDTILGNSTWSDGDWNNDDEFTSADLVAAFQTGNYENAAAAVASVPEPASVGLLLVGMAVLWRGSRRRRRAGGAASRAVQLR